MGNRCLSDMEMFWGHLPLGFCCGFGQDRSEVGSQAGARSCRGVNTCQAAPDNSATQRHFPRLPAEWSIIAVGEGFPVLHTAPQPPLGSLLQAQVSLAVPPLENKCCWVVLQESWCLILPLRAVGLWNTTSRANYCSLKRQRSLVPLSAETELWLF